VAQIFRVGDIANLVDLRGDNTEIHLRHLLIAREMPNTARDAPRFHITAPPAGPIADLPDA
ncbi:MAG: hypothetical protein O7A08_09315, partial [SAR324 cluster bacterium]|nr:hypothetical protein [SAR324 cluster bacterium]